MEDNDGWGEWRRFILKELERHGGDLTGLFKTVTQILGETAMIGVEIEALSAKIDQICSSSRETRDLALRNRNDLSALSVKAGIWGAIGASIPAIGLLLWQLLTK